MRFYICLFIITLGLYSCNKKEDKTTVQPPVTVSVEVVNGSDISSSTTYSGVVSPSQTVMASFSVAGTVSKLNYEEGAKISKGALLATLQNGDYQNSNNIAQAELAQAQDAYNRLKKLHDANALPEIKWVEVSEKLKQAQNAAQLTERTLNDASLYSPMSGVINRKYVSQGENIAPMQPIYEILSEGRPVVEISVPEGVVNSISIGDKCMAHFPNSDNSSIECVVTSKSVTADPLTRGYMVKCELSSQADGILPGMTADVTFSDVTDSAAVAIKLPSQAVLLTENNRNFVWIVKNGRAERRFVEVDRFITDGVKIESGLNPGDSVITAGMQKVGTGSIVLVK